jgi:hypothetical protein
MFWMKSSSSWERKASACMVELEEAIGNGDYVGVDSGVWVWFRSLVGLFARL